MADQRCADRLAGNDLVRFRDVSLVEAAEDEFVQLMGLFAAWRAEVDSEPFAYSDEDLLRAVRRPSRKWPDRRWCRGWPPADRNRPWILARTGCGANSAAE